jgi:hypothetical protein
MFLHIQLAQPASPLVDFYYLRAYTRVVDMHDLELAIEKFPREQFASEFQNLPDRKHPITHDHDAGLAHVLYQAGKPVFSRLQFASVADRNTHFSTQIFGTHG